MKHTLATTVKWSKILRKIHNLKVKSTKNDKLFSELSGIYRDVELLFDIYNKYKLTDKELAIFTEVKKEKIIQKVKESYKKELNKTQRLLDKAQSPEERKKIGYLKYKAKLIIKGNNVQKESI
tara:strand:- start:107 stop:475 length:369 start_codon:yes stop_codon:yes gene_type:complete